ncbi:hypothetical protein D3C87_1803180 [compost metagenome]
MRPIVARGFQRPVFEDEGGHAAGGQGLGDVATFGLDRQVSEAAARGDDDGRTRRRAGGWPEDLQRRSGDVADDVEAAAGEGADDLDLGRVLRAGRGAGPDIEGLGGRG